MSHDLMACDYSQRSSASCMFPEGAGTAFCSRDASLHLGEAALTCMLC